MTPLPPDRSHVRTEHAHPASLDLDTLRIDECVHLMIDDQRAVYAALKLAADELTAFIESTVQRMAEGGRLIYLGAGTSGRLGVLDASECPPTFQAAPQQVIGIIAGGDQSLRRSSEGKEDEYNGAADALDALALTERDTVLGIAAGGTTPYVLGGIAHAHAHHATTALLTCASATHKPDGCDHLIVLDTGPELLTGSTRLKAGTATKIALNTITTTIFTQQGKVYRNLMVDVRATNDKLRDRAIRILRTLHHELTREEAARAIDAADGSLKTAIMMHSLDLDRETAERRLAAHNHNLRDALKARFP